MRELDRVAESLISNKKCRCIAVLKGGNTVYEKYRRGVGRDSIHPVNSITKTVVSILMGIALDRGCIGSLDDDISEYIPEAQRVSIRSHLTMTSGMDWSEGLIGEASWKGHICSKKIVEDRAGVFQYNGGSSHLLGISISNASGMSLEDFAKEHLFDPLGIELAEDVSRLEYRLSSYGWKRALAWDRDPEGYSIGSFGLSLKVGDLLKLGSLILGGGVWNGKRVVSKEYLEDMIKPHVKAGLLHYGYHIWVKKTRGVATVSALGYGNQYLTLLPEHDAVIVILSENDGEQSSEIEKRHGELIGAVSKII